MNIHFNFFRLFSIHNSWFCLTRHTDAISCTLSITLVCMKREVSVKHTWYLLEHLAVLHAHVM